MVLPIRWGKNQAGMQASMEDLSEADQIYAEGIWREAAEYCAKSATMLSELGLHKQWANRMLEWFGTITGIVTTTELFNWWQLRCHPDAQPEIRHLADLMLKAYMDSTPAVLKAGEWHLPYITPNDYATGVRQGLSRLMSKISAARCARVSYLNHDGTYPDVDKDLELFERLAGSRPAHLSPLEHSAECQETCGFNANFDGWKSFRFYYEKELSSLDIR